MKSRAFAILELLAAMVVIIILASIVGPKVKGMQDEAKAARARNELKTLQTAVESYYRNQNNTLPGNITTDLTGATPQLITSSLVDPFASNGTDTYKYLKTGAFYAICSVGFNRIRETTVPEADGSLYPSGDDLCRTNGIIKSGRYGCPEGLSDCDGICKDLQTDVENCGTCGNAGGPDCCAGSSVDLQTDVAHCGTCGNACAASGECVSGACYTSLGQSCTENDECISGVCGGAPPVCRETGSAALGEWCSTSADCQSGYCGYDESWNQACTTGITGEAYCFNNSGCASGYCNTWWGVCSNGESYLDSCYSGSDCQSGYCDTYNMVCSNGESNVDMCYNPSDCQSGTCAWTWWAPMCTDRQIGSPCGWGGDCDSGYCDTYNMVCSNGESNVDYCNDGADCQSGTCVWTWWAPMCSDRQIGSFCGWGGDCDSGYCNTYDMVCSNGESNVDHCNDGSECQSGTCGWAWWPPVCSDRQIGAPCSWSGDCDSGYCNNYDYVCSNGESNVDRCSDGSACQSGYCNTYDYICSNGESNVDRCASDSECQSGTCISTGDAPLCSDRQIGAPCQDGNDCESGYCNNVLGVCSNGETAVDGCTVSASCQAGICGANNICGGENVVDSCTSDDQCQSGVCGSEGICGLNSGDACTQDSDCQDNFCSDGICQGTYDVTYNGNGHTAGTVPSGESNLRSGTVVTVSGNTGSLAKSLGAFQGWNTAADGTGVDYAEGETFTISDSNVTLYAQWELAPGCVATGGTITTENGAKIHKFTSNGSLVVTEGCTAEYLVVAGGGGGGPDAGGGGGAGGLLYNGSYTLNPGTYTITIGAGGAAGPAGQASYPGGNSSFGAITATGGGRGGYYSNKSAGSGGSGGGKNICGTGTAGSGIAGQGYAGHSLGGGGGAGAAATSKSGGNGRYFSQFVNVGGSPAGWFAGGGAGGAGNPGTGGLGGGANGDTGCRTAACLTALNGVPNTGGGGGGGFCGAPGARGGSGGAGIVIVRYNDL
ncbi:MAG: hypothetical protein GX606_02420 [Elusimicrobia bacterium]|nr:hypothetical protein [Elusimicrobiota bacterium]